MKETIEELERENRELKSMIDDLLETTRERDNEIQGIKKNIEDAIYDLNRNM